MKTLQQLLPFFVFLLVFGLSHAQSEKKEPLPAKVVEAVKQGDISKLSPFLNDKIELVLPGESGIFSKEQAHFILRNFFKDNKVTSFQILHHGARQNATFAIGEYKCTNEQFRMYFLVKTTEDGKSLIHQIRIEKQE
jgi:hypothetical protein